MFRKFVIANFAIALLASVSVPSMAEAGDRRWRDRDERHHKHRHHHRYKHCKRDKGTGGLVIGAVAGGLLGREIAGDKTAGTIIGGGVGALAGREIDKSNGRC